MIKRVPKTRISLILRLTDVEDACAWEEFVEIYQEFIYRYGIRRGLQHSDAEELTQNVLVGLAKAIQKWEPDPDRAKFRTWLFRIAQNQFSNLVRKQSIEIDFDANAWRKIESDCSQSRAEDLQCEDTADFFRTKMDWAFATVNSQVQEKTWEAFRLSYIEGLPIKEVVAKTGITAGQVYVARSRVIKRLKHELSLLNSDSTDR